MLPSIEVDPVRRGAGQHEGVVAVARDEGGDVELDPALRRDRSRVGDGRIGAGRPRVPGDRHFGPGVVGAGDAWTVRCLGGGIQAQHRPRHRAPDAADLEAQVTLGVEIGATVDPQPGHRAVVPAWASLLDPGVGHRSEGKGPGRGGCRRRSSGHGGGLGLRVDGGFRRVSAGLPDYRIGLDGHARYDESGRKTAQPSSLGRHQRYQHGAIVGPDDVVGHPLPETASEDPDPTRRTRGLERHDRIGRGCRYWADRREDHG